MSDIQKADPKARRLAVYALVACAVVGATVLWAFQTYRSALEDWVTEDRALMRTRLRVVLGVLGFLIAAPLLGIAVYCWRFGRRVVQAGRFPPPGTAVIRDTLIVQGQDAEKRGRWMQIFAVILAMAACLVLVLLWLMANLFDP